MKPIIIVFLIFLGTALACNKTSKCTVSNNTACQDTIPQEACTAQFNRWFYNATTKTCSLISYSGCSAYGFATQIACDSCACSN